jgi:hypothetical protein
MSDSIVILDVTRASRPCQRYHTSPIAVFPRSSMHPVASMAETAMLRTRLATERL